MENLFNTAIYIYIIMQLLYIHQAIHYHYKYAYLLQESTTQILLMDGVTRVFSWWNIPLIIAIVGLIAEAKGANDLRTIFIIILVAIAVITHYSRKYYSVVYETIKQIDTKTITSPTPFIIAFGVPCSIGLVLGAYQLSTNGNTMVSALIAFSFSSVVIAILIELFYPLFFKNKNSKSHEIFQKIKNSWQQYLGAGILLPTIVFGINQIATVQCMDAIDTGSTKSIKIYCGIISNLDLTRTDFSLWIVSQLSTNIWWYGVLIFTGFSLLYWGDNTPEEQKESNHQEYQQESSHFDWENSQEEFAADFDFEYQEDRFADKDANTKEAPLPYGIEKRHPDDKKLWARVDDPASSPAERMASLKRILKKEEQRKE